MNFSRQLRELIIQGFGREELRTLCFDLDVEYDDLPAEGRSGKARELIIYMDNRGRTAELLALCAQRRPLLEWPDFVCRTFSNGRAQRRRLRVCWSIHGSLPRSSRCSALARGLRVGRKHFQRRAQRC